MGNIAKDVNAEDKQPRDVSAPNPLTPKILGIAFMIGIPLYVILAWFLQSSGAGQPSVLGADRRTATYALLAFVGLGSAIGSFLVRKLLTDRANAAQGTRPFAALVVGLALSEVPAILGLVYFVFSYDWAGFLLLVTASVVCFILHALPRS